jgi:ParB family chromosome partitioning protein
MTNPSTASRLVHLDPNSLVDHPGNVRDDLGDLDELTASIRQVGVLEPLVVVPTEEGHRIVTGHRRKAAAIAAGLATVPCYERPDLAADSDQVLAMLVENLRRDDLTELEEARGYQQLLDLGMSATKIANATGTSRSRVRDALAVTKSDTALTTATAHGLSLDQALVLTEFEGDDDALDTLTEAALQEPDGLLHVASRIRQDRERQAHYNRLVAEHETAGVTILEQRPEAYGTRALTVPRILEALIDGDDQVLDPAQHAACPGHAVWIETYSWQEPRAIYACVDPQAYGHLDRYGSGGQNKLPEEAKAERREVIENNKAWRAAEPVRTDHIRSLLNAGKVPKGTLRFVTAEIKADPAEIGRGSDEMIAELTGTDPEPSETSLHHWGRTVGPAIEAKASDARLPLVLLAQVAAAREQSMDVYTWRKASPQAEARWLSFLAGTGYTLSAIEQAVIDHAAAAASEEDGKHDPAANTGTDEPPADEAA